MDPNIFHTVWIGVDIKWKPTTRNYEWAYHICMYDGPVTPSNSGDIRLGRPGRTVIVYELLEDCRGSYQLLHANLDPSRCATSQIESVCVDHDANKITVVDRNDGGATGTTPFSLKLVARMKDNIASGFISPDPQVVNAQDLLLRDHQKANGSSKGHPSHEPRAAVG